MEDNDDGSADTPRVTDTSRTPTTDVSKSSASSLDAAFREVEEEEDDNRGRGRKGDDPDYASGDDSDGDASVDDDQSVALRRINPSGKPPEAGIIVKVYVENFMCHKKMSVDLCSNINFINGQNGSGKSAVLAAIQICLGAGAARTNRAKSLQTLINHNGKATHAKIRVKLLNKGSDAFQHDTYGDYVTVERIIDRGGGGGYKLLDYQDKVKSKKKVREGERERGKGRDPAALPI